jgi:hypothetical protein
VIARALFLHGGETEHLERHGHEVVARLRLLNGTPHAEGHTQFGAVDEVAVRLLRHAALAMPGQGASVLDELLEQGHISVGTGKR